MIPMIFNSKNLILAFKRSLGEGFCSESLNQLFTQLIEISSFTPFIKSSNCHSPTKKRKSNMDKYFLNTQLKMCIII
jgi:hypothetical protein